MAVANEIAGMAFSNRTRPCQIRTLHCIVPALRVLIPKSEIRNPKSEIRPCTFATSSPVTRRPSVSSSSRRRPMRRGRNCSKRFRTCRPSAVVRLGHVWRRWIDAGANPRFDRAIHRETSLTAVSHLTCVCHTLPEMEAILDRYAESGIENILALGGDPPGTCRTTIGRRMRFKMPRGWFASSARVRKRPIRAGFGVGVAGFPEGHPGTPNRLLEMDYFKRKVDAGADYICTQLFFDNNDFYDFREHATWPASKYPSWRASCPSRRRRVWCAWRNWPWGPDSPRDAASRRPLR